MRSTNIGSSPSWALTGFAAVVGITATIVGVIIILQSSTHARDWICGEHMLSGFMADVQRNVYMQPANQTEDVDRERSTSDKMPFRSRPQVNSLIQDKDTLLHVCVTGGAGYIGSHFALKLLEDGHAVTIIDNLSRGNLGAIRQLQKIARPNQLQFYEMDIGLRDELAALFQHSRFDVIVHFAAVAYVAESYKSPLLYYRNVTVNTMNVLDAMMASNVRQIVYSSTCATYGDQKRMPITESTPQRPVSPYGSSKLASERIIKELVYANTSFSSVILRYFNVIGSDPHGACFDAALGSRPGLSIMGADFDTADGTCVRDYIHVMDLVEAHLLALRNFRQGVNRVYNVGIGKGYSVREFISACRNATGVDIKVTIGERRPGDAAEVYADPAKIKAELRWEPKYLDLTFNLHSAWNWTSRHPTGYAV